MLLRLHPSTSPPSVAAYAVPAATGGANNTKGTAQPTKGEFYGLNNSFSFCYINKLSYFWSINRKIQHIWNTVRNQSWSMSLDSWNRQWWFISVEWELRWKSQHCTDKHCLQYVQIMKYQPIKISVQPAEYQVITPPSKNVINHLLSNEKKVVSLHL